MSEQKEKGHPSILVTKKPGRERLILKEYGLSEADFAKDIRGGGGYRGNRARRVWKKYGEIYNSTKDKGRLNEVVADVPRSYWRILAQKRPDALDYVLTENVRKFYNLYGRVERS